LEERFILTVVSDLTDASNQLFDGDFDIVLLDVSSQKLDGLAMCKAIAGDCLTEPPFVVAMGEQMEDEQMREIFKAGAYDYFVRPFNVVLFHESLQRLITHVQAYKELQESDESSRNTMSVAMAQASFYGFAFDLMADIGRTNTNESLANAVLYGLAQRGIHCAIQFTDDDGQVTTFEEDHDVVGERTIQVFDLVKNEGRIFRFGQRLVFNDENVSLLVKSMDDKSEIAHDCVLDIGAKLIPCLQTKLLSIKEHSLVLQLQDDMRDITEKLHTSLQEQVGTTQRLIDNVVGQINLSIDKLELTEEQEAFFLNLVEKELHVESAEHSIQELEVLASKIYEKLTAVKEQAFEEEEPSHHSSDIEFF
jgi:CheY-like chemotaxis protein